MWAAIIGLLTSIFSNGSGLIKTIANLFKKNPEVIKREIEDAAEAEARQRDQGGKPKWD